MTVLEAKIRDWLEAKGFEETKTFDGSYTKGNVYAHVDNMSVFFSFDDLFRMDVYYSDLEEYEEGRYRCKRVLIDLIEEDEK